MIEKLQEAKKKADADNIHRVNYQRYIKSRIESGHWTETDVSEYKAEVKRIMTSGTDDEKQAAREFWASNG